MKKYSILSLFLFLVFLESFASDPFRSHKYDLFKVLPVNDKSIVFVGNSITNMHEWWEAFGSDANILNRGVWGTFIGETVQHIEAVAVGKPKKVFFMVGTNDLGKNGSRNIDAIIDDTRVMVERLQMVSPATEIYIQGILPSVYNRELEQLEETNVHLKELCSEYGITYVDLWDSLFSLTTDNTHTLDGLHMKASGYQIWTRKIEELVGAKSVYPDDCVTAQGSNGIANASLAMRATIFSMLPVNEGDIIIVGDEMIHGGAWHELLKSNRVKNRGSGWGYPGPGLDVMLKEIPLILNNRSGSCKPSKVLLYGGAAELNGTASLSSIEDSYRAVVEEIRKYAPGATVCLMSLQPTANYSTNLNRVVPFNGFLKSMAAGDEGLEYIDIYTDFQSGNVASSSYFSKSYLNAFGYVEVAQRIAVALADEELIALTDDEAQLNYRTFEMRSALGNALVVAGKLKEGDGTGEYPATALVHLNSLVEKAYSLLSVGGSEDEFTAVAADMTAAAENVLKNINMPQMSNSNNEFWYKLYTPNRGSRYMTSNGGGAVVTGSDANNFAKSQWKFVERSDGTIDIVNRGDGTYLSPNSAYNSAIYTTVASPSHGWSLSYSNTPGLYIISSAAVQLNQTQADLGWKIYNWSSGGTGQDRNDTGCQYCIESVTEEPDEIIAEPCLEFSFSRGSTLENSVVRVTDEDGKVVDGIVARIAASGAASWLASNKASADSILCLNVNTNATTVSSPIIYTLEIEGLDSDWSFNNITFRSVALNSAGNWQGATETRHCNFRCVYDCGNNGAVELPVRADESIMVGGGTPKDVAFDVSDISASAGKLTIMLQLYKGTNNNGCFYGLTGVVMKRNADDTATAVKEVKENFRDVKGVYDIAGRRVDSPEDGIYIVDGVKRFIK